MTYLCPKGHQSSEADYCSECGVRIGAPAVAPPPTPNAPIAAAASIVCPACGATQTPGARFCEVCRYDFVAAQPSDTLGDSQPANPTDVPAAVAQAVQDPVAPQVAVAPKTFAGNLWAVLVADRTLISADDQGLAFPENEPERSFPLDLDEMLVGRRNARPGVHPEIPVNDPSVSARHLKICRRRDDGGLTVVDIGSSNGSILNGARVDSGVEVALNAGDQILIGAWTRITIEAR